MCTGAQWGLGFGGMALGDSDVAVNVTQVGLQGNNLSTISNWSESSSATVSATNGGSPNYESINNKSYTFNAGHCTGTVKEFVLCGRKFNSDAPTGDPLIHATQRVVLDVPIVKGSSDYLTIEHRLTTYPELNDVTGVIDVSGVAYNYLLRGINIHTNVSRPAQVVWHDWANRSGTLDDMTTNIQGGPTTDGTDYASGSNSYFPAAPIPYVTGTITAGVDDWNKDIRTMQLYNSGFLASYQVRLGKVSDDTPLEKLNTHVLTMNINMYAERYVP